MMMMVKQFTPQYNYSKLTLALSRSLQWLDQSIWGIQEITKLLKAQSRGFHIIHTVPIINRFLSDDNIWKWNVALPASNNITNTQNLPASPPANPYPADMPPFHMTVYICWIVKLNMNCSHFLAPFVILHHLRSAYKATFKIVTQPWRHNSRFKSLFHDQWNICGFDAPIQ